MTRDPKRRAIPWTDADLDRLAEITPEAVEESRAWWHRHAPARYRELLDATPEDDQPDAGGEGTRDGEA